MAQERYGLGPDVLKKWLKALRKGKQIYDSAGRPFRVAKDRRPVLKEKVIFEQETKELHKTAGAAGATDVINSGVIGGVRSDYTMSRFTI